MKVLYDIQNKIITTWWDEEINLGQPDEVYPGEENIKKIYDFPDISNPSILPYPLDYYHIDKNGKLIHNETKTPYFNTKAHHFELSHDPIKEGLFNIDKEAEYVRRSFITTIPGQILNYTIKESEARRFISDGRPTDTTKYKMLTAESKSRKIDINDLADIIIAKADEWITISANIEAIRLQYKDLIKSLNSEKIEIGDITIIVEEATRLMREI